MSDRAPSSAPRPARSLGIDLARGLAVVLMIQTHAFDGWVSSVDKQSTGYWLSRVFSNIPAPLFLLLAGLSLGLQAQSAERAQKDLAMVRAGMARRALEVVGYGYLVSLVYALLDWRFDVATLLRADILHCIGLSLLVCTYLLVGRGALGLRTLLVVGIGVGLGLAQRWLPHMPLPFAALLGLVVDVAPITRFPLLPLCGFTALGVFVGMRLRLTEWSVKKSLLVALGAIAVVYPLQQLTHLTVALLGGRLSRAHPAVIWNFLEGTARAMAVLAVSLAASGQLSERTYGWLLRLGRGSMLAYAFHIPLCYGRVAGPVIGQLNMAQATPLVLLLIALTWLVVWLRDGIEQRRKLARIPQSVVGMLIVLLGSSAVMAQPSGSVAGLPAAPAIATPSDANANEQSVIASELAQDGQHALAFALWPSEAYRARVEVAEHFSLKDEVERCHQLFGAGQFRESAEAYAHLFAARPDLVRVLFNIAQSLRRAGESRPALAFYRRYLDADPQTPLRAEVDGYIRELSALVSAKAQLGRQPSASPPLYKRAWFWVTLTGGVALVVTTAVILGVTLNTPVTPPPPEEVLGPFDVVFPRVN